MLLERLKKSSADPFLTNEPVEHTILLQPRTSDSEVIPDSEEERHNLDIPPRRVIEIIEISSDESEMERVEVPQVRESRTPIVYPSTPNNSGKRLYVSRRRIIESSDEDEGCELEPEVIEISDSDSSIEVVVPKPKKSATNSKAPLVNDSEDEGPPSLNHPVVDESIIILNEPRSAKKPLRFGTKKKDEASTSNPDDQGPKTPKKLQSLAKRLLISNTSGLSDNSSETSKKVTKKVSAATPRANTKKAREAAELQRRHEYAQKLFTDLNKVVFKEGLPMDTKLNWNKRLLTTAGKAKYHRSREGVQTTEIELAEKILDCEERIRNTLSHEMCHLATWVIDKNVQEHHGKLFKSWAALVMKKRPDIHVSIRHDYEISYPYQWKCQKCDKIYGRFSKSIKPEECVCGACKEGTLIPQFTSKRKPNTSKLSRMAAAKPQDSPSARANTTILDLNSDSDSEDVVLEMLTQTLASTSLA